MTPGEAEALGADGEPVATLASLDDALISTIATFMRPEAIAHVAACSKPLRRVCADDALWSGLLERHFGAGAAAGAGQMGARLAFGRAVVLRRWHLDARTPAADADTPSTPENRAVNLLTRRVQAMRMSLTPDERKALRHLDLNMDVCSPSPARPLRDASFDHILRKRLARDLFELVTRPADGLTAFPASEDMLEWHATVPGRAGYADEGRTFQLVLLFGAAAVRDGGAASGAEGAALLPRVRVVHPVALRSVLPPATWARPPQAGRSGCTSLMAEPGTAAQPAHDGSAARSDAGEAGGWNCVELHGKC